MSEFIYYFGAWAFALSAAAAMFAVLDWLEKGAKR